MWLVGFIQRFNVSEHQQTDSEITGYLQTSLNGIFGNINISAQNLNFSIRLMFREVLIMILTQKRKVMQNFAFAIS